MIIGLRGYINFRFWIFDFGLAHFQSLITFKKTDLGLTHIKDK